MKHHISMRVARLLSYVLVCTYVAMACDTTLADDYPAPQQASKQLESRLAPLIEQHRGEVAVVIEHLPSKARFAHRPDEVMPTASLIKLPILMAAYQAVDDGSLALNTKITLQAEDQVPGSGILTSHFSPGTTLSVRDALHLMIAYSDNTATNLVIDQIGIDATNELMQRLGCPETRLNSMVFRRDTSNDIERSKRYGLGSTTCNEMIRLLAKLQAGEFVNEDRSQEVLTRLYECLADSGVPRDLPEGVRVAHKTGSVGDSRADAGIIDSPAGPIAFCVLTTANEDKSWGDDNEAELLAAEMGRAAYESFVGSNRSPIVAAARILKMGSSGTLVESLQRTLNARLEPNPSLSIDGDFGPNTDSAVRTFQKEVGLEPTGQVDREVWAKLGPLVTDDPPAPSTQEVESLNASKLPEDPLAGPPVVTCKAWCFVDAESGQYIDGDNADAIRDPASITKIMTCHLVLKLADEDPSILDETITFSEAADETSGSTSALKAGEQLPIRELLYGLMLPSGNDASVALAEHCGEKWLTKAEGSGYERFIQEMNEEAARLGMANTGYENPHGLTAKGHRTTASDMAKLAVAAMRNDLFREIVATRQYVCHVQSVDGYTRDAVWNNTNRLLKLEGYSGIKTGTTDPAGACLVSCATRGERTVIGVILGASCTDSRYADTRNLYRYIWQLPESKLSERRPHSGGE